MHTVAPPQRQRAISVAGYNSMVVNLWDQDCLSPAAFTAAPHYVEENGSEEKVCCHLHNVNDHNSVYKGMTVIAVRLYQIQKQDHNDH